MLNPSVWRVSEAITAKADEEIATKLPPLSCSVGSVSEELELVKGHPRTEYGLKLCCLGPAISRGVADVCMSVAVMDQVVVRG
jgi:hypothetical protein